MLLRQIFDPYLAQYAYLVGCQRTGEAIIFDPERDIERYRKIAKENGLRIVAAAETHIHADFVSGLQEFADDTSVRVYVSDEGGADWSYRWPENKPNIFRLKSGEQFKVGGVAIEVLHTPGHTPEHICFVITDVGAGADQPLALISGDFLFVGDVGRPDLLESAAGIKDAMQPAARELRTSLSEKLSRFGDYLQIYPGHGAGSACGKSLGAVPTSTLGYERRFNGALKLALADGSQFVKAILEGQPDPPLYFARMKKVNRDGIAVTGGVPVARLLGLREFGQLALDKGVRIVDVSEDREVFDSRHVARSINAPLRSSFFYSSTGSYLASDESILLVVESESELEIATCQLYRIGFDKVLGGITRKQAEEAGLLTAKIPRILFSQFDAKEALREGEIIDVRGKAEYDASHIEGARLMPYTRLKTYLAELPRDRMLFVHCASGRRATLAASFLAAEGFDAVHVDGNFCVR